MFGKHIYELNEYKNIRREHVLGRVTYLTPKAEYLYAPEDSHNVENVDRKPITYLQAVWK